ncbi:MAG TPA: hypothetical protein VGH76_04545 [Actinomycetospora sp.]|jgi:hypothetical protein|uniref:hypothetical protein n=1 Tax=Actinomycetospora sp. TaxID=1872135 RepID=UPI002F417BEB
MAKKDDKKADKSDKGGDDTAGVKAPIPKPPPPATVPTTPSGSGSADDVDAGTTTPTSALTEPGGNAAEIARRASPASSAPLTVDTTTPVRALTAPAGDPSLARGAQPGLQLPRTSDLVDGLTGVLRAPAQIAGRVLPARRAPVVLGVAALTLIGVLDWPAAIAAGLGYEALRRWAPSDERPRTR